MNLEDCIKAVADLGADGVEILGEQMLPNYPWPDDEFFDKWFYMMDKYKTTPTCYDAFIDWKMYKYRCLTDDECADIMRRDMKLASKLGFKILRAIAITPLSVIEKCLPYAEELDLKLGVEIHSPLRIGDDWYNEKLEFIQKKNTKYFGFVPDMGIFVKSIPFHVKANSIERGGTQKIIEYINEAYENQADKQKTLDEIIKMGGNEVDQDYVNQAFHYTNCGNPEILLKVLPYTSHIHAKFYKMDENSVDSSIPYEEIVKVLVDGGYEGYLSSEYEGQEYGILDSVEQVRRQHNLFKRIIV
jgi:sugar phosphate isomerase/epimerase